jgi:hypothetical protein
MNLRVEIVEGSYLVALSQQPRSEVRTDETGATRDQNGFCHYPSELV